MKSGPIRLYLVLDGNKKFCNCMSLHSNSLFLHVLDLLQGFIVLIWGNTLFVLPPSVYYALPIFSHYPVWRVVAQGHKHMYSSYSILNMVLVGHKLLIFDMTYFVLAALN